MQSRRVLLFQFFGTMRLSMWRLWWPPCGSGLGFMLHKQKVEGSNTAFARLFKTLSLNQQKLYQTKGFFETQRHFWKTFSYFFPISASKSVVLFFRYVRHGSCFHLAQKLPWVSMPREGVWEARVRGFTHFTGQTMFHARNGREKIKGLIRLLTLKLLISARTKRFASLA